MKMSNAQKNTVNIIGCGGVGVNCTSLLEPARNSDVVGFAKYNLCYVDTSKSNMIRKKLNADDVFLFEDMDGSGKIRKENHKAIAANTKAILQKFKPTDFNIVIHSAAGGSGSVLAPSIVSELLKAGKEVIVVVIASFGSVIEVENTTKTLQSYEAISELREKNVNLVYLQNSTAVNDELQINSQAMHLISMLLGLFSGEHEQLDTADLKTWLNHNKVTGNAPCINNILIGYGQELKPYHPGEHFEIEEPIAVATLATRDMNTRYNHTPSLKFEGYVPSEWKTGDANGLTTIKDDSIHFCVMEDKMEGIYKTLANFLKDLREAESSRVRRKSILGDADTTDDGMVL
jgi:hypothetical protein